MQEAAHRQAAAVQDDAGAGMSVLQGKVHSLEAALAEAHATVSNKGSVSHAARSAAQQEVALCKWQLACLLHARC